MFDRLTAKWMCLESRDFFNFREIGDNISLTVQNEDIVPMKH